MQNLNEKETGNFIRELRKQAGLTQKELGGKIGISDKAISNEDDCRAGTSGSRRTVLSAGPEPAAELIIVMSGLS